MVIMHYFIPPKIGSMVPPTYHRNTSYQLFSIAFRTLWIYTSFRLTTIYPNKKTGESLLRVLAGKLNPEEKDILAEILSKKGSDPLEIDKSNNQTLLHASHKTPGNLFIYYFNYLF